MTGVDTTAETPATAGSRFMRSSVVSALADGVGAAVAVAAGYAAMAAIPGWISLVLLLLVLSWLVYRLWRERGQLGHHAVVRVLTAASVTASFSAVSNGNAGGWLAAAAFACLAIPIMLEKILRRATTSHVDFIANLPGISAAGRMPKLGRPAITSSAAVIVIGAVTSFLDLSPIWWLLTVVLMDVFYLCIAFIAARRIHNNSTMNRNLGDAVRDYEPEFIIYNALPDLAPHHVMMWLPYLARTGRRFIVVTRNEVPARAIAESTDAPVVVRTGIEDLEVILVNSIGAVFYVNASSGNGTMVRYPGVSHVFLGHGDSDKPTSYNPLHAMYDKIFAAGPAATRRYGAHDVIIEDDKFEIVGRPQLESVQRLVERTGHITSPTVLYAPTWRGNVEETMLYSLPVAPRIIERLLERDATVIFRPHPYSYQSDEDLAVIQHIHQILSEDRARTGRHHLFGAGAETDRDVVECANLSDAMISDVSSVVSDYLYSGKPFAMVAVSASEDQFVDQYPIARAAYVLDSDLSNINGVLDQLLCSDPLQKQRLDLRADYLGDFPAEGYAEHFVAAADRMIARPGRETESEIGEDPLREMDATDDGPDVEDATRDPFAAEGIDPSEQDETPEDDDNAIVDPVSLRSTLARLRQKVGGRTLLPSGISLAAFLLLICSAPMPAVVTVGLLGSLMHLVLNRRALMGKRRPTGVLGAAHSARALLALTFGLAWTISYGWSWPIIAASLVLVVTIAMETSLEKAWMVTGLEARHLPGAKTSGYQPIDRGFVAIWTSAATALCWVFAYVGAVAIDPFILSLLPFGLAVMLYCSGIVRGVRSARLDWQLPALLEDYEPQFAVYFGSTMGIGYQLGMWLPYFRRMDRPFVIITRSIQMMRAAGRITKAPVIYRPTLRSLEDIITPAMKAALYVNNAGINTHFVERREMTHVWLNHGDSEKPACYNPVHGIYDRIFAAGQAGIDRYARHGVHIPRDKFEITGRPQVERIKRRKDRPANFDGKTVLYAPTWKGPYKDTAVYSLPRGEEIVQALLERDCTVIFRAHSLNYQFPEDKEMIARIQTLLAEDLERTGRQHIWGSKSEKKMSLTDCFNASDAMISDVSAVVTDYLQSDKPFSIVSVGRSASELADDAPASEASYVIAGDLANLDNALDQLLHTDPLSASRDRMRKYYLGDFNARHYADAFVDAATDVIDERAAADEAAQAVTHLPRQTGTELRPNATTPAHEFSQTANCAVPVGRQSDGVLPEDR